jgi:hypothetical protein
MKASHLTSLRVLDPEPLVTQALKEMLLLLIINLPLRWDSLVYNELYAKANHFTLPFKNDISGLTEENENLSRVEVHKRYTSYMENSNYQVKDNNLHQHSWFYLEGSNHPGDVAVASERMERNVRNI